MLDKMVGLDRTRRHCVNYQQARTPQSVRQTRQGEITRLTF